LISLQLDRFLSLPGYAVMPGAGTAFCENSSGIGINIFKKKGCPKGQPFSIP